MAEEIKEAQGRLDTSEPTPERQAELRAAHESNVAAGKPPYYQVRIQTRGELHWLMKSHTWGWGIAGADLRDADFNGVVLGDAALNQADLSSALMWDANLRGAQLAGANLANAALQGADLTDASMPWAKLGGAGLGVRTEEDGIGLVPATLVRADLHSANLTGTDLEGVDLSGANLRETRMDAGTVLARVRLSSDTLLADVIWGDTSLMRIDWETVTETGDAKRAKERLGPKGKRKDDTTRLEEHVTAVRTYRQLATVLRTQGLNEVANRFAYEAQVLQRFVLWKRVVSKDQGLNVRRRAQRFGVFVGFNLLDILAGHGYKFGRSVVAYLVAIFGFGLLYWLVGPHAGVHLSFKDAVVFSMTSFHGRGFAPSEGLPPSNPVTELSAGEALVGLVIEVAFIATFTQRFFAR